MIHLPTLNACLNALAFCFLLLGWLFVKKRMLTAHKACMWGAIGSSAVFLTSYLYYHFHAGRVVYTGPARPLYLAILLSHTVLAVAVLPMLWRALMPALAARYDLRVPRAKVLLPVWMYVSVTGVVVYVMLYRL